MTDTATDRKWDAKVPRGKPRNKYGNVTENPLKLLRQFRRRWMNRMNWHLRHCQTEFEMHLDELQQLACQTDQHLVCRFSVKSLQNQRLQHVLRQKNSQKFVAL